MTNSITPVPPVINMGERSRPTSSADTGQLLRLVADLSRRIERLEDKVQTLDRQLKGYSDSKTGRVDERI
jgi:hypothetical protein